MNTHILIDNALHWNGVIEERARLQFRPLSYEERNIIWSARRAAALVGFNPRLINTIEMEGQMDKSLITEPIRVKAVFAYYDDPYEEVPARASYHILKSNHPSLPENGNVEVEQLQKCGIEIPRTPTYESWVKHGQKIYRGSN